MKYIIIDLRTKAALYGLNHFTLVFDTENEALKLARQFFDNDEYFAIIVIQIKP